MRSMILAFACIAAVACGTVGSALHPAWLPVLLAGVALTLVAVLGSGRPWAERRAALQLVLLVCLGLLRGASVGPSEAPRLDDRGAPDGSVSLRTFTVVGASEPGPRCRFEVEGGGAPLQVSAPIEACPLARGDAVAILAGSLQRHWGTFVHDGPPVVDLGRGPVLWRRPDHARGRLQGWIDGYWHWVAARRQRAWVESRGDAATSLVVAVGLGLRAALEPEQREHLRAAGLGHLIAVSGLHVAIAAVWLQFLARRLATLVGVSPAHACVIAWLPLWAYVGLTGAAASAVRAALMLTLVDLGTVVGRPIHPPTTLAISAAAMLLWQPQWLLDPGFLLSLAAMAAIVTAPRELGVLATSWRITWATAPLSVWLFDAAPLHGLLANFVALPLFGLMMPPALVAVVGSGAPAELALLLARCLAAPILDLAAWLAAIPSAGPATLSITAGLGLGLHALVGRRLPERARIWLPPRLACVLAVALSTWLCLEAARPTIGPPRFDWVAVGSVHSRSLLIADRARPGHACIHRPTGSDATWIWLLRELGVTHVDRIDAMLPGHPPASDPRTRALAAALERAGIEVEDSTDGCAPPGPAEVRAALRACRFMQARGPLLVRSWAGARSCRIETGWVHVQSG